MVVVGGSGSESARRFLPERRIDGLLFLLVSFGLGAIHGLLNDIRQGKAACTKICLVWTVRDRGKPPSKT